jgi:hypothetical protein
MDGRQRSGRADLEVFDFHRLQSVLAAQQAHLGMQQNFDAWVRLDLIDEVPRRGGAELLLADYQADLRHPLSERDGTNMDARRNLHIATRAWRVLDGA